MTTWTGRTLGVIGGSGFYNWPALEGRREIDANTPFGPPPDGVLEGFIGNTRVLFVSRHGLGHRFPPEEVPYKAIVFALKALGADTVIGVSAVGSLQENIHPGDLAVVRQYIDDTGGNRPSTFFGKGVVGHIGFADPVCSELANLMCQAGAELDIKMHDDMTLRVMRGPAFSTRAESLLWHNIQPTVHLVGMTAIPEAKLAREAALCYVTLALSTDYDCWRNETEPVTVAMVQRRMMENVGKAKSVIEWVATHLPPTRWQCGCGTALDCAIMTDPSVIGTHCFEGGSMGPIFGRALSRRR